MPVGVLHVCDKFGVKGSSIHGVSRLFSWWFPRYDPSRFSVSLCGLKKPEPASLALEQEGIDLTHLSRNPFDPRIFADLLGLARRKKARILHVHGYASADFGRLVAPRLGAALVLHEHFADPKMPAYQGVADRFLRSRTDRAIAVSESTRAFLVEKRYVPQDRVRVIFNGAPLEEFSQERVAEALALRRELRVPEGALLLGSVARLSAQKGHRFLLEAFRGVLDEFPKARLLIVGDGDQEPSLRALAERLRLGESVIFAGHRKDVATVLAALDIFCISSTYEGTPLTLFEAMAAGKAIVSTQVDGCSEVLDDGKTGLLVPKENPGELRKALVALLKDPARARALGEAAGLASKRYHIQGCVTAIEAVYDEVLAEARA